MFIIRTYSAIIIAILFFLTVACNHDSSHNQLLFWGINRTGAASISAAEGGTVEYNDEVKLTVPKNSLEKDSDITIEKLSQIPSGESDGLMPFGQAYRFSPRGTCFDLSSPAVLEMRYDEAALKARGFSPETIEIYYFDDDEKRYIAVTSNVDTIQKKITARIEHFTIYLPMARAMLATNNSPYAATQNPIPNPVRIGAPLYCRATVRDYDGSLASVRIQYRKLRPAPGAWEWASMTKETQPNTLNTYGFLLPSDYFSAGDLGRGNDFEYRVEAIDNLGAVTVSSSRSLNITRTYAPRSLSLSPSTLSIAAGFQQYFVLRGRDTNRTAFQVLPEEYNVTNGIGTMRNHYAAGILFQATTYASGYFTAGFGGESVSAPINVLFGDLNEIEILDTNGQPITGDLLISEGSLYAFDAVGYDEFKNKIPILPLWNASIGAINQDGMYDSTGSHGAGTITIDLGGFSDTQSVIVRSTQKEITSFSISGYSGRINGTTISIELPANANVASLTAVFSTTGASVMANGVNQVSGETANNFSLPVVYRVFAEDGSWRDYTVMVSLMKIFKRTLGGSQNDYPGMVIATSDGGYLASAYTWSTNGNVSGNHGGRDAWLLKFDQSGNIEWSKCLGGTLDEDLVYIVQTNDGGYIASGYTRSNNGDVSGWHGGDDFWLVKLDAGGNIQWQTCLGGSGNEWSPIVKQTADGGYLLTGETSSHDGDVSGNHGGFSDIWAVKLDAVGTIEWQRCLGGSDGDYAYNLSIAPDGNYIIAGMTRSNDGDVSGYHGMDDIWVVKLSQTGTILWQRCLGGSNFEIGSNDLVITNDNGFMVTGATMSNDGDVSGNHGASDIWVVKLDQAGDIEWQKCFGGSGSDQPFTIRQTADGGSVIGADTGSNDGDVSGFKGNRDIWVLKIDQAGTLQWQKSLGGSGYDGIRYLAPVTDGYLISGGTDSNNGDVAGNHGSYDYWAVKIDQTGNMLWQRCIGGSGDDSNPSSYGSVSTPDGGLMIHGYTNSNNGDISGFHGAVDLFIVKLDGIGNY